jgi:hypothetical protein
MNGHGWPGKACRRTVDIPSNQEDLKETFQDKITSFCNIYALLPEQMLVINPLQNILPGMRYSPLPLVPIV